MNKKNKLTYTCSQKIPFPNTYNFDIMLDRNKTSETDKMIQVVKRLSQTYGLMISPVFSDLEYSHCKLSANLKEITKTAGSWFGYIGQPKLPAVGKNRFSVKILKTSSRSITIGVTVSGTTTTGGFSTQAKSWMFYINNGQIYNSNAGVAYFTRFPVVQGDVISVLVDMDTLMLSFKLNSVSLGPAPRLNLQESEKQNLCPAVDLHDVNDSVVFL